MGQEPVIGHFETAVQMKDGGTVFVNVLAADESHTHGIVPSLAVSSEATTLARGYKKPMVGGKEIAFHHRWTYSRSALAKRLDGKWERVWFHGKDPILTKVGDKLRPVRAGTDHYLQVMKAIRAVLDRFEEMSPEWPDVSAYRMYAQRDAAFAQEAERLQASMEKLKESMAFTERHRAANVALRDERAKKVPDWIE